MIKYQKIQGVKLSEATSLPNIVRTPEGVAMGAVPGWAVLLDPAYVSISDNTVLNRARGVVSSADNTLTFNDLPSGHPAFFAGITGGSSSPINIDGTADINPSAWTVIYVGRPQENDSFIPRICIPKSGASEVMSLNIGLAADTRSTNIYENSINVGGQPIRLSYEPSNNFSERDSATLLMYTFSEDRGLAIFDGGEKVAEDISDTRPLDFGTAAGEWGFGISLNGWHGLYGLLNIDLGAPENTGHRRSIEKFLMDKYDIPEGPQ